jgi:hypothetical protein
MTNGKTEEDLMKAKTDQEIAARGAWKQGQWPDSICSGFISYEPSQYGGYMFRDASHGIPVLGHVKAEYHGSYPDQAERIARRLVACWNACANRALEDIEAEAARKIERIP